MNESVTTFTTGGEPYQAETQAVMPIAYRKWQVETFDKMRDALWQITWAKTLEQAIEQARKALDLTSTTDTMPATGPDEPLVDCPVCGGSGFSGYGSGYDDVCGECGGQRQMPARFE
jgi:hypothetical protein